MNGYGKSVAMALCLLAQLIALVPPGAADSGPTLVWDGDRTVDGLESYSGEVIELSGDLTVTGSLSLEDTVLIVSGKQHGDRSITVDGGGKLTLISGSVIRSSDPEVHYTLAVYSEGRLLMNGSRISDCGWDDIVNGSQNPEDVRGPYIATDNARITNSTLTGNGFGLIIDGGCAPFVQDCNISRNHGDGVRILGGSSPVIDRNTFAGNAMTYPWFLCFQADITAEGGSARISNNTITTVTESGWVFPNEGIVLGVGSQTVENNTVEGFDGEGASYYGIMVMDDCSGTVQNNILRGNLEALVAFAGRLTVTDNLVERGTPVSQMNSYGIEDGSTSCYANNTVKGYDTGVVVVSPSTSRFENLTVTDCGVGIDAFSIPGSTFTVTVANSTLARNGRDAQATNPHFGDGGKLTLVNPSYDRNKVAAPGATEKLVVAWYIGATARFESDGRPAAGALFNFTDAAGALAAQDFARPDGSLGPVALAEYVLSGGVRAMKSPYSVSAASDRWTNKTSVQVDQARNVNLLLDDIAPWIRFESPQNGSLTNVQGLRVNGSCEPKASVRVNGMAVTPISEGRWSLVIPLMEGENLIRAQATDAGQNTASAELSVVLDTVRPELSVRAPGDGLLTNRTKLTVSGSAEPGAVVKVNGATADCGPDGSFWADYDLFEGENTITVECRDAAGNLQTVTRRVVLDTVAPALAITAPKNGTLTKEASLTLAGRAEPESAVTVNGAPVNLNGAEFSLRVTLSEGENLFAFQARDRAGNVARASLTVWLDTMAPQIVVIAPAKDSLVNRSTVEVRGTTEADAIVKVQGVKVALDGNGFCANLTIPGQGAFTITVEARDAAGNQAQTTITVTLDTEPPALRLTGPAAGTVTNQSSVKVTGKTEPGARVHLGKTMVVADAKGVFSSTVALPDEGRNVILVEAADAAGNAEEASVVVFRDTVLSYNVTTPAEKTRAKSVIIGGVAEPGATVTVAGKAVTIGASGTFAVEVPLETGQNEIRVTVRDPAGNQGETVLEITREKPTEGKSTPGFECLLLLSAIALALAAWRKRN